MTRKLMLLVLLLLFAIPAHAALPEICGDGIDNDASGGDLDCPNDDADNDGYRSTSVGGADCDDNNHEIFPGSVPAAGTDAYDWKECQSDGTYGANNAATDSSGFYACTGGVNNYYICQTGGSDVAAGTSPATCWATVAPFLRTGGSAYAAGDCLFLVGDGTYSWSPITDGGYTSMFPFRITDGTAEAPVKVMAYPGSDVTVDPGCNSGSPCSVFSFDTSNYIQIYNIKVTGGYNLGIATEDVTGIKIFGGSVYDIDGTSTASINVAGVRFTRCTEDCGIYRTTLLDNFKTTGDANANENASNIVVFDSLVDILYTRNGYTNATDGGYAVKYKHARDPAYAQDEVAYNILFNAEIANIGTGSPLHIHNNQILGGTYAAIQIENLGGETKTGDMLIERNSISGAPMGFRIRLDETYTAIDDITIRYNSIVGAGTNDLIELDRYASTYTDQMLTDHWFVNNNCYWDSGGTENWSIAKSAAGDEYGTFAGWQAAELLGSATAIGHDANSYFETPNFSTTYAAQAANCTGYDWATGATYLDTLTVASTSTIDSFISILKKRRLR